MHQCQWQLECEYENAHSGAMATWCRLKIGMYMCTSDGGIEPEPSANTTTTVLLLVAPLGYQTQPPMLIKSRWCINYNYNKKILEKCKFSQRKIKFLGHVIDEGQD